jgi:hypothetical protein
MSWTLLELLVRERGRTVSKHDVMTTLWPDDTATEYAMSRAVRRLREALGDDARNPRYLRTVHRAGFQWLAPTHVAVPSGHIAGDEGHGDDVAGRVQTRFVGRREELDTLTAEAAVALGGRRRWVAVEGDLGVGKTTLLQRFVGDSADAWWVATVSCVETRSGAEPYGPVLTAIDRLAARRPDIVVAR